MTTNAADDTLGHQYIKVPVGQFMNLTQHREKIADPTWLVVGRNAFWGLAGGFCVIAAVLTLLRMSNSYRAESVLLSWLWVGTVAFLFCALHTQTSINQRRIMSKADETRDELRAEFRASRPAEQADLGQVAALLDANASQMRQLQQKIDDNERQRQADFDQIRENSRKALGGLHDKIEGVEAALPLILEEAARKGYAVGYTDALAQGGGGRALRPVRDDR